MCRAVGSSVCASGLPTAVAVSRHGSHMVSEKEAFGCTKHADMSSIFSVIFFFLAPIIIYCCSWLVRPYPIALLS